MSGDRERLAKDPARSRAKNRIDTWIRFWSSLGSMVTFGILITVLVAYLLEASHVYPNHYYDISEFNSCSITVKETDIRDFHELVLFRKRKAVYVELMTHWNVSTKEDTDVYLPNEWIWTYNDSGILGWPQSYVVWSFGLLDQYTARDVKINLELSPDNCSFTWGDRSTMLTVGNALMNMTMGMFDKQNKLKESSWCYKVKLRDFRKKLTLNKHFSFYVQDIAFKCFSYQRNIYGDLEPLLNDNVEVERVWTDFPFIFSFIALLFSPWFLKNVYQYLSFDSHVHWVHHRHHVSESQFQQNGDDKWIFTDYKSPVTFLSFIWHYVDKYEESKVLRYILLAFIMTTVSLSVLLVSLLLYLFKGKNDARYKQLEKAITNDIPIGFLSVLFPYENSQNFMSNIGGPYVFLGIYVSFAVIELTVLQYCQSLDHDVECDTGMFTLNLDLVKKYGGLNSKINHKYGILETIHANRRAILKCNFLCEFCKRHIYLANVISCSKECIWEVIKCVTVFIFSFEFTFIVHLIPFLFASQLVLTNYILHKINKKQECLFYLISSLLIVVHFVVVIFFIWGFISSVQFMFLMFSFCVLSIVYFPRRAAGFFVFFLAGIYYIIKTFRKIARNYATYRDLTISVCQELCDKCRNAEAIFADKGTHLVISGIKTSDVKNIVLYSQKGDQLTNCSCHCHLKENSLTVIDVNTKNLEKISINGYTNTVTITAEMKNRHILKFVVKVDFTKENPIEFNKYDDAGRCIEDFNICYVRYKNGLPGIPQELMNKVVDMHIPTSAERLRVIIQIGMIVFILVWLTQIFNRFTEWQDTNIIVQALVTVFLTRFVDTFGLLTGAVDEDRLKIILKEKIRLTVLEYWNEEYGKLLRGSQLHARES